MKRGFTFLELIIVIIILGILATLGFSQYTKLIERGRTAEAKLVLGTIRSAEETYFAENSAYTGTITDLLVSVPTACTVTSYFSYGTTAAVATATRCSAGGKAPQGPATPYTITLTYAGAVWGGSAGYF